MYQELLLPNFVDLEQVCGLGRAEIFGKDIEIEEGSRHVSDQEVFSALVNMAKEIGEEKLLRYQTLVSDEAGGRLPTIFLRDLINIEGRKNGGASLQNTFFLRGKDIAYVGKFVEERKKNLGETLMVTELVRRGSGTRVLAAPFVEHGIRFDVATISCTRPDTPSQLAVEYPRMNLFIGESELLAAGEAFHRRDFNGVLQGEYKEGNNSAHPKKDTECSRTDVVLSRKIIRAMAQEAARII